MNIKNNLLIETIRPRADRKDSDARKAVQIAGNGERRRDRADVIPAI